MKVEIVSGFKEPFQVLAKFSCLGEAIRSLPKHMDIEEAIAIVEKLHEAILNNTFPREMLTNYPWIIARSVISKKIVFTYTEGLQAIDAVNN